MNLKYGTYILIIVETRLLYTERQKIFKYSISISMIMLTRSSERIYNRMRYTDVRANLTKVTSPPNSTTRRFRSYLLLTLPLYFLFILYFPRCNPPLFPSVFFLFLFNYNILLPEPALLGHGVSCIQKSNQMNIFNYESN